MVPPNWCEDPDVTHGMLADAAGRVHGLFRQQQAGPAIHRGRITKSRHFSL
jgi:hypothetical protein